MKWAAGIVLFVVALVVSLAIRAPAALLAGQIAAALPPGAATGPLEGTVWNGHTASVTYGGVALGSLTWHVEGVGLFPPGAKVALELDGPNVRVTGKATGALGGTQVTLDGVDARLLPGQLASAFGFALAKPTGAVHIAIDSAVLGAASGIDAATGKVEWNDAGISDPAPVSLGNVVVDVTPKPNGGLAGRIVSSDGSIDLDGTLSLDQDGTYRMNVAVVAGPTVPSDVTDVIRVIAPADAAGVHRLVATGKLGGGFMLTPPPPGGPGLSLRGTSDG